ncbi:hypothetical protein STHU_06770 [Allostella humosa]|nr:hypothetical protein STHU_06770 [Stella humosa]
MASFIVLRSRDRGTASMPARPWFVKPARYTRDIGAAGGGPGARLDAARRGSDDPAPARTFARTLARTLDCLGLIADVQCLLSYFCHSPPGRAPVAGIFASGCRSPHSSAAGLA